MSDPEIDPELRELLRPLKDVPEREPGLAAQGRANYMAMAHRLASEGQALDRLQPASTKTASQRFKAWIGAFSLAAQPQPRLSMVRVLVTLIVAAALLFGGTAGTVYAAQYSQPGQALYPLKIASEDVRLDLTSDPEVKFQLALALADRRTLEIGALLQDGKRVPATVADRLESHIQLAFNLAAALEENGQTQALLQLQAMLRDQERIMSQAQTSAPEGVDPVLTQIRQQIRNQLMLIDTGLEDPRQFQQQLQQQEQNQEAEPAGGVATEEPGGQDGGYGPGPGSGPTEEPGAGQMGPMAPSSTAPAGSGAGPGSGQCDPLQGCEPSNDGSGSGSGGAGGGNGTNNQNPSNPIPSGSQTQAPTQVPGNGAGPGGNNP